jgi:hypothetical protein
VNNRSYSLVEPYIYHSEDCEYVDLDSSNNEDTLFNSEFDKRVLKHFNERIEELKKKFDKTSPHVDEWD